MRPLVVLGIGNLLLTDDGFGPAVVSRLEAEPDPDLPPETELIDGGTAGLALLPVIARARALLVVDAIDLGGPPGTLHVLIGEGIGDAYRPRMTAHQVGAADLLAAARLQGTLPSAVALIGVQPASTDTGIGLSSEVAGAEPLALAAVRDWCWQLHQDSEPAGHPGGDG